MLMMYHSRGQWQPDPISYVRPLDESPPVGSG